MKAKVSTKSFDGVIYITDDNFEHFLELISKNELTDHFEGGDPEILFSDISEQNASKLVSICEQFTAATKSLEGYIGFGRISLNSARHLAPLLGIVHNNQNNYGLCLGDIDLDVVTILIREKLFSANEVTLVDIDDKKLKPLLDVLKDVPSIRFDSTVSPAVVECLLAEISSFDFEEYKKRHYELPVSSLLITGYEIFKCLYLLEQYKFDSKIDCGITVVDDHGDDKDLILHLQTSYPEFKQKFECENFEKIYELALALDLDGLVNHLPFRSMDVQTNNSNSTVAEKLVVEGHIDAAVLLIELGAHVVKVAYRVGECAESAAACEFMSRYPKMTKSVMTAAVLFQRYDFIREISNKVNLPNLTHILMEVYKRDPSNFQLQDITNLIRDLASTRLNNHPTSATQKQKRPDDSETSSATKKHKGSAELMGQVGWLPATSKPVTLEGSSTEDQMEQCLN